MNKKNIPNHIAVLIDGNRRWAKKKGLSVDNGHLEGFNNFNRFCDYCWKRGIKTITAFLFSTENWNRSREEVSFLMNLFEKYLKNKKYLSECQKQGVKIKIIGQKERFSKILQEAIKAVESLTENNKNFQLNLAISYGGRWDILQAVKRVIDKKIPAGSVTEDIIKENLSTGLLSDPDFIIRTSGEQRISNFLLWQGAYSELYFSPKMWPDFTEKDLDEAIEEYYHRQRRFGK